SPILDNKPIYPWKYINHPASMADAGNHPPTYLTHFRQNSHSQTLFHEMFTRLNLVHPDRFDRLYMVLMMKQPIVNCLMHAFITFERNQRALFKCIFRKRFSIKNIKWIIKQMITRTFFQFTATDNTDMIVLMMTFYILA